MEFTAAVLITSRFTATFSLFHQRLVAHVLISPQLAGVSGQNVDFSPDLCNFSLYFASLCPAVPLSETMLLSGLGPFLCILKRFEQTEPCSVHVTGGSEGFYMANM